VAINRDFTNNLLGQPCRGRIVSVIALSVATAINDRGQVVGWSTTADGLQRSFLWEKGTMRQLGTDFFNSLSINNRGQVVVVGPGGMYLLTGSNATFIALPFNPAVVNQLARSRAPTVRNTLSFGVTVCSHYYPRQVTSAMAWASMTQATWWESFSVRPGMLVCGHVVPW
jgi:probable HAF family extracellular repeat protein